MVVMVKRIATSLYAASTEQSADSVESHPTRAGRFALGTYQITQHNDKEDGAVNDAPPISRKGILRLMQSEERRRNDDDDVYDDDHQNSLDVQTLAEVETEAILDMKWLAPRTSLLSVAFANATLGLYKMLSTDDGGGGGGATLVRQANVRINATDALCLSLDWSDRQGGFAGAYNDEMTSSASVVVSQSDGTLAHIPDAVRAFGQGSGDGDGDGEVHKSADTWKAHDYEAWIAAFDCWQPNGQVLWSGGDDLTLKGWDVRTSKEDDGRRATTFTHKRSFEGGVTCMQSHHLRQHVWAVGSYDERLRLFDARHTVKPLVETHVGGGAWRVKWHPTDKDALLVACMHDGFKVLRLDEEQQAPPPPQPSFSSEWTLATRFDGHESLAYGCDWDRGRCLTNGKEFVYSCSFYDAMLHAWQA